MVAAQVSKTWLPGSVLRPWPRVKTCDGSVRPVQGVGAAHDEDERPAAARNADLTAERVAMRSRIAPRLSRVASRQRPGFGGSSPLSGAFCPRARGKEVTDAIDADHRCVDAPDPLAGLGAAAVGAAGVARLGCLVGACLPSLGRRVGGVAERVDAVGGDGVGGLGEGGLGGLVRRDVEGVGEAELTGQAEPKPRFRYLIRRL